MVKLMRNMFAKHQDYADFKGLIATNPGFVPCDLDGIAERNGQFLIMEWKKPGEKLSEGQKIMLKSLAKKEGFIVTIIVGNTDEKTIIEGYWQITKEGEFMKSGTSFVEFKQFYRDWYALADGYKR